MNIFVIPCSQHKLDTAAPCRDLYIGPAFRNCLAAARASAEAGDLILILSAKHGFLRLDDVVEPYDLKMGQVGSITATKLAEQFMTIGCDSDEVWCFLPRAYFERLDESLRLVDLYPHNCYEAADRGIGEQRRVNRLTQRRWP